MTTAVMDSPTAGTATKPRRRIAYLGEDVPKASKDVVNCRIVCTDYCACASKKKPK